MSRLSVALFASVAVAFAGGCAGRGQDGITGTGAATGTGNGGTNGGGSTSGGNSSGTGGGNATGGATGAGSDAGVSPPGTGGIIAADGGVAFLPSALPDPDPCTSNAPGPRKLWRLSAPEFAASIHSIFNDTANAAPVATVFSDPSVLGFSIDANALLVQGLNASQLEDNAEAIAAWAASAGKLAQFASCASTATGAPAMSCATSFITAFGRVAFRTTLASSDPRIGTYSKLFMAGSSNADGAQAVISAMLQSPYFLYRSELGTQSGSTFALTPYEVGSELAYTLTGTAPDSTLLSAMDSVSSGSLSMSSMIDQQATRLLASGAATNSVAVMGFMNGWLGLPRLFTTAHDATVYQISATVQNEMQTESQDLIMEAFNGGGTFGAVLTPDHSWLNADLATFYGLPTSGLTSTFKSVKYGGSIARDPGLLATGTILNGYARPDTDSPTQRGHLVRTRMLCQDIQPPPPGLNTTFMPATTVETTRDHFINEHEQGQCKGCHRLMDWIGFAFENYDGWGRYRTTDNGLPTDDTATIFSAPTTSSTALDVDVTGLSGTGSLQAYLAGSDELTHCMQQYWTYYVYGSSNWSQDGCTLDSVYSESQSNGFALKSTLMAIIHAPNFTTRVQDQ
jgi:hypothetical protein